MNIIRPPEEITIAKNEPIIALLGPVPRSPEHAHLNWHGFALTILSMKGYDGHVCIPLREGETHYSEEALADDLYMAEKYAWDDAMLSKVKEAHHLGFFFFWIPKEKKHMAASGTEKELQALAETHPDRIILGIPEYAEEVQGIKELCKRHNIHVHGNIKSMAKDLMSKLKD